MQFSELREKDVKGHDQGEGQETATERREARGDETNEWCVRPVDASKLNHNRGATHLLVEALRVVLARRDALALSTGGGPSVALSTALSPERNGADLRRRARCKPGRGARDDN
jgi:hypothetical protein